MAEDWRLTVTVSEPAQAVRLRRLLEEHEDVDAELAGRVAVSGDDEHVFLYAGTAEAAHAAERLVRAAAPRELAALRLTIDRWHPLEERWEPESVPLPQTEADLRREHARREEDERALSRELGQPLWEVRVELDSHRAGEELAERLAAEGRPVVRRWRYLLLGADSEDEATALAERVQREQPGARVHPEPSGALVWRLLGRTPLAFMST